MSEDTENEHDWEALGREAMELDWRWSPGCKDIDGRLVESCGPGGEYFDTRGETMAGRLPDFSDRLTVLACIAWVEDVARDVYGETAHVDIKFGPAGPYEQRVAYCRVIGDDPPPFIVFTCPTLAEACIAAVRAMKGES